MLSSPDFRCQPISDTPVVGKIYTDSTNNPFKTPDGWSVVLDIKAGYVKYSMNIY